MREYQQMFIFFDLIVAEYQKGTPMMKTEDEPGRQGHELYSKEENERTRNKEYQVFLNAENVVGCDIEICLLGHQ